MLKRTFLCCIVSMLFAKQAAASCALLEERSIMLQDSAMEGGRAFNDAARQCHGNLHVTRR